MAWINSTAALFPLNNSGTMAKNICFSLGSYLLTHKHLNEYKAAPNQSLNEIYQHSQRQTVGKANPVKSYSSGEKSAAGSREA